MQEARKIIYSPTIHPGSSPAFGGNILGLCWPSISAEHGAACPASQQIVPFKKRHKNLCVVGKTSCGQSQIAKKSGMIEYSKDKTIRQWSTLCVTPTPGAFPAFGIFPLHGRVDTQHLALANGSGRAPG